MSVDVEVYLSGIIKFFRENPKDLLSLVPKDKEEDFYSMIRKYSFTNYENGDDYVLTRNQILEICVQLNEKTRLEGPTKIIEVSELDVLKKKLDIALETEEYEEAAKLRDQIKEIS
jgi:hypothetical protein